MLTPQESIRNLLGRYCELMDAADWDGLADLFSRATLTDDQGNVAAQGADDVRRLYGATKTYEGSPRTKHLTSNTIIEFDDSMAAATARSAYVVFQGTEDLPLQPIITGRYRDRFACGDDGRWHFTERCFSVDSVGDLSHHLRFEVPRP